MTRPSEDTRHVRYAPASAEPPTTTASRRRVVWATDGGEALWNVLRNVIRATWRNMLVRWGVGNFAPEDAALGGTLSDE